jgi:hypothetical protein
MSHKPIGLHGLLHGYLNFFNTSRKQILFTVGKKHIHTLYRQNAQFSTLKQVIHLEPLGFKGWSSVSQKLMTPGILCFHAYSHTSHNIYTSQFTFTQLHKIQYMFIEHNLAHKDNATSYKDGGQKMIDYSTHLLSIWALLSAARCLIYVGIYFVSHLFLCVCACVCVCIYIYIYIYKSKKNFGICP